MTVSSTAEKARELQERLAIKLARVHPSNRRPDLPMAIKLTYGDIEALCSFAALTASPAQGEWISVPREPTEAMVDRFVSRALCVSVHGDGGWSKYAREQWSAMLAAAPVAPSSGEWIEREVAVKATMQRHLTLPALDGESPCQWQRRCIVAALRALPSTPKPQELAGER